MHGQQNIEILMLYLSVTVFWELINEVLVNCVTSIISQEFQINSILKLPFGLLIKLLYITHLPSFTLALLFYFQCPAN